MKRQPLLATVATRAIKAQSCKTNRCCGSIKAMMCFQTCKKYRDENNLPPKLSRCTHNQIPPKILPFVIDFSPQNQNSQLKLTIIGEESTVTTSNILSHSSVVQLSKATKSSAQKARILLVTPEFRTNDLPLIMISEPGRWP